VQVESTTQGPTAPTDELVTSVLRSTPGIARSWSMLERRSTIDGNAFRSRGLSGSIGDAGFELGGGRFPTAAGEAIVGYGFLTSYGVHVGDTVEFDAGPTPLRVRITGWYRETEDSGRILMYPIETLQRAEPGAQPDEWQAVAKPDVSRDALAQQLGTALGPNVHVEALSVDSQGIGPIRVALGIVALLVALVAGAQLLAATVASARERARDLGVLRSVGATTRGVLGQHAFTGALLGTVAVVVGLPFGLALYRLLSDAVTKGIGAGPGFSPMPPAGALVLIGIGAIVLAAAVGMLALRGLVRRPASELVRWE
jgi:putative ABC transport system permease protein